MTAQGAGAWMAPLFVCMSVSVVYLLVLLAARSPLGARLRPRGPRAAGAVALMAGALAALYFGLIFLVPPHSPASHLAIAASGPLALICAAAAVFLVDTGENRLRAAGLLAGLALSFAGAVVAKSVLDVVFPPPDAGWCGWDSCDAVQDVYLFIVSISLGLTCLALVRDLLARRRELRETRS
jgi:hypothetical protein